MQPVAVPKRTRDGQRLWTKKSVSHLARPSVASHIRHNYDRWSQEAHAHILDILNKSPVSYRTNKSARFTPPERMGNVAICDSSVINALILICFLIVQDNACYQDAKIYIISTPTKKLTHLFYYLFFRLSRDTHNVFYRHTHHLHVIA